MCSTSPTTVGTGGVWAGATTGGAVLLGAATTTLGAGAGAVAVAWKPREALHRLAVEEALEIFSRRLRRVVASIGLLRIHAQCKSIAFIAADYDRRICDNNPNLCAIILRLDMAKACTGTPGGSNWIWDGKPAFETRVNASSWSSLHPTCPITSP